MLAGSLPFLTTVGRDRKFGEDDVQQLLSYAEGLKNRILCPNFRYIQYLYIRKRSKDLLGLQMKVVGTHTTPKERLLPCDTNMCPWLDSPLQYVETESYHELSQDCANLAM